MTFGGYLQKLRKERKLRQIDLANQISVTPVFICDIEKGHRYPPDINKLRLWATLMKLSKDEAEQLFDLAGTARSSAPPDIAEYLELNPSARNAIRRIMGRQGNYNWDKVSS